MADVCNTCRIFMAYEAHAASSLTTISEAVSGPVQALAFGLAGCWFAWIGIQVFIGTLDLAGALKQAVFLVFGFGIYKGIGGAFIGEMFTISVDIMGGLSAAIMDEDTGGYSGIAALLFSVEKGIGGVFKIVSAILSAGGFVSGINIAVAAVYAVALLIPYVILLVLFLSHTAVSLFRLTLIFGISPILIALAAFPFGRNMIGTGVRTVIGAIMTMLCVTTVFSIVIASVSGLKVTENTENIKDYIDLSSGSFLLALIMGWLGATLVSEAVNIAGQVSSSVLGSVSAGIMSAGAVRGASLGVSGGRMAMGAAGKAGGFMRDKTWEKPRPPVGRIISSSENS